MHNFELNNGCGFVNYQTQHRAMVDKPAKAAQMYSIMAPSWIQRINVTNGSKQVHQSQHHRGLKVQPHLGNIVGGNTHKIRGIKQIITMRGGRVLKSFHRSPLSDVATSVPPAEQMAKRSHPFTDEASKNTGAWSKQKPIGNRVLALASVRHEQSSPLTSAQEKAQSDVECHENPSQASQVLSGIQKPQNQKRLICKVIIGCRKENRRVIWMQRVP